MVTCRWVQPRLVGFFLGELPTWQSYAIARHVSRCPRCVEQLEVLRQTLLALAPAKTSPPASLPPLSWADQVRLRARVRVVKPRPASLARGVAAAAFLALGVLWLGSGLGAPPIAGTVVRVSGQPMYRLHGKTWQLLADGAQVPVGAVLRTGEADAVEMQFDDGSRLHVDFDSQLRVDTRQAEHGAPRADLELQNGRAWLLVTHAQKGLRVRTAAGTAEALGTYFEVSAQPGAAQAVPGGASPEAAVTVLRGQVQVSNRFGSVVAGAGTWTEARRDRAPDAPKVVSYLKAVRAQAPWGESDPELLVIPWLELGAAAERVAGRHGWLGVRTAGAAVTLSGLRRPGPGLTVAQVDEGSPAARAGLLVGDLLVRVGDLPITHPEDVARAEVQYLPGERTRVVYLREHARKGVTLTLGERVDLPGAPADPRLEAANRDLVAGRTSQAQRAYAALRDSAVGAAARHNLGVIAEATGLIPQAQSYYRQAVLRKPREARFHFSLAFALARLGNFPGAVRELQATLQYAPDYPEARFYLGRLLALLGKLDLAGAQAKGLFARGNARAQGFRLAGDLAYLRNDLRSARRWYEGAYAVDPLDSDTSERIAKLCQLLGYKNDARKWAVRALAIGPDSARVLNRLGDLYCANESYGPAIPVLRTADQRHPGNVTILGNLSRAYFGAGRYLEAQQACRKVLALDPGDLNVRLLLAEALEQSNDLSAAVKQYSNVLARDPTCAKAYQRLASLQRRLKRGDLAHSVEESARRYGV